MVIDIDPHILDSPSPYFSSPPCKHMFHAVWLMIAPNRTFWDTTAYIQRIRVECMVRIFNTYIWIHFGVLFLQKMKVNKPYMDPSGKVNISSSRSQHVTSSASLLEYPSATSSWSNCPLAPVSARTANCSAPLHRFFGVQKRIVTFHLRMIG